MHAVAHFAAAVVGFHKFPAAAQVAERPYQARHLIENFFAKLKQCRAIATRYDKTARNFLGVVHLAATVVWLA
ncbi:transposase [Ottowia cancrivicina]|uniref:transposase n=1 Tax=Ottowia cancrivicina TaxID=3040346 RepID=UPI003D165EF0